MDYNVEGVPKAIDFFGKAINGLRRGTGWSERPLRVQKGLWCQGFGNFIDSGQKSYRGGQRIYRGFRKYIYRGSEKL